jgi:hypothetical protein
MIAVIAVFIAALAGVVLWLSRRRPRGPLDMTAEEQKECDADRAAMENAG